MKAIVHVFLKPGVLDPQGKAIGSALAHLGFDEIAQVRQGKYFEVELADGTNTAAAREAADRMAETLLANLVIENYRVDIAE